MNTYSNRNKHLHASGYGRLHDYRVEHKIVSGADHSADNRLSTALPRWHQQVQYALGHTLNDFYSLQPDVRRETPIQFLLERRWPHKGNSFTSLLHYWDIKTSITDELMRMASVNHLQDIPIMLYEQWSIAVPELNMELSMIFQLVWKSQTDKNGLIIQKYVVTADEELITGFLHMTNVFCQKAFGVSPEKVEIYSLLDGKKHSYDGSIIPLAESLDYVRLLSVYMEKEEAGECSASCGCRRSEKNEEVLGKIGFM